MLRVRQTACHASHGSLPPLAQQCWSGMLGQSGIECVANKGEADAMCHRKDDLANDAPQCTLHRSTHSSTLASNLKDVHYTIHFGRHRTGESFTLFQRVT